MLKQRKNIKPIKEEICNIQWDVGFTLAKEKLEANARYNPRHYNRFVCFVVIVVVLQ